MEEHTLTGYDFNNKVCEIMVNINDKGKLIRLYTYKDSIPKLWDFEKDKQVFFSVKPTKNDLFVELPKSIIWQLRDWIIITNEDQQTSEALNIFISKYDFIL